MGNINDPDDNDSSGDSVSSFAQHPLVTGIRPNPSEPPLRSIELVGFPGDTERSEYQRLYLNSTLDYYAEFALNDVLYASVVPAEISPFPGHEVVSVRIRAEAAVDYTRTLTGDELDDFDLDVRIEAQQFALQTMMSGGASCGGCSLGASCSLCPSHNFCPSTKQCPTHVNCPPPHPSGHAGCPPQ
jgi:hypothetical protein